MPAKIRIRYYRICYRMCFIFACVDVTTQLELYLHEQKQIVANAACRVGRKQMPIFVTEALVFIKLLKMPFAWT